MSLHQLMSIDRITDYATRYRVASNVTAAFADVFGAEFLHVNMSWYDESADSKKEDGPFLIADWNEQDDWTPEVNKAWQILGHVLQCIGVEVDWEDTTTPCQGCGCIISTEPGFYFGTPKWRTTIKGEDHCMTCVRAEWDSDINEDDDRPEVVPGIVMSYNGVTSLREESEFWPVYDRDDSRLVLFDEDIAGVNEDRLSELNAWFRSKPVAAFCAKMLDDVSNHYDAKIQRRVLRIAVLRLLKAKRGFVAAAPKEDE